MESSLYAVEPRQTGNTKLTQYICSGCVRPPKKDAGRGYACYDCCMPIPCLCLHAAPYFSCHHHWFCLHILYLVPVLFSIVIPTSLNILMKCFSHLFHMFSFVKDMQLYFTREPHPFCSSRSRTLALASFPGSPLARTYDLWYGAPFVSKSIKERFNCRVRYNN